MKAIGLLSGGLDSQLSIRLMLEQGVEITAVHFRTIFCTCPTKECCKSTLGLGISFVEFNNTKEFLEIVKDPPHGYGSGMNPCIDCRILMFKKAKRYMEEIGADFIVTGEVIGQRPMSQRRGAIELIENESGLCGLVVRPLSAQLLPQTIPEQKGWIDRNRLLAHSGRSRKLQISLASGFGMKDYPCAAGGCLLTDPGFTRRIKESFQYGEDSLSDVQLLKIGRHFRLFNKAKLVVGRNEMENKRITNLTRQGDILIEPFDVPGPTALLRKGEFLDLALGICARYCDGNGDIRIRYGTKEDHGVNWSGELYIKKNHIINNDYCRRI